MHARRPSRRPAGEEVLRGIDEVLASNLARADKAARVAALIREAGRYRWVGLYAVGEREITAIGWSGPGAPAHPRFPVGQGLSGAAVASRRAVVVNDVTADPRYLTAFSSTLSEAIIPVLDPGTGTVVGTLIGAFLVALIRNGSVLLDINTFYQQVIIGVVIWLAVFWDQYRRRRLAAASE